MLFTIITATYNAAATLPRLLDSLAAQTCRDFNVIIQDGASKDDTVAIAESYRDKLPELLLESVPDTGIYDAWNRALTRAGDKLGGWVLFLGADDMLADNYVLLSVSKNIAKAGSHVLYAAGKLQFMNDGMLTDQIIDPKIETVFPRLPYEMSVGHPALFHRSTLFSSEEFNPSYKIAGDYDFLLRTWKQPSQGFYLPVTITCMSDNGISASPQMQSKLAAECFLIRIKKYPVTAFSKYFYAQYHMIRADIKSLCDKFYITRCLYSYVRSLKNKFI